MCTDWRPRNLIMEVLASNMWFLATKTSKIKIKMKALSKMNIRMETFWLP
jgi:hypothetical protein